VDEGEDQREADRKYVESLIKRQREQIATRRLRGSTDEWAELVAEQYRLPQEILPPLRFGLAQVRLQVLERARDWLTRGPIDEIPIPAPSAGSAESTPTPAPEHPQGSGAKLSELLPAFLEFMTTEEGWRGQTIVQNTATYRMFVAHCGDRAPTQYVRSDATSFYDVLRQLPAEYSRSPALRQLPPAEIVERTRAQGGERLTMKTVKRHFSALGRLFRYFKRRGEMTGENPAHGFEFSAERSR
jgi:hypothetical protein